MFICPNCNVKLSKAKGAVGVFWTCPSCAGRSATVDFLRRTISRETVNSLWNQAKTGEFVRNRSCPSCDALMSEVPVPGNSGTEYVDVCTRCRFVWFDSFEYEVLPAKPGLTPPKPRLPMKAREKIAEMDLQRIRRRSEIEEWHDGLPTEWWQIIPAFLGMPVERETRGLQRAPLVTWVLTFVVTLVSVLAFLDHRNIVYALGMVPAEWGRYGGLTLLTSFFLHGGVLHLFGNMYFFATFGDNVEDYLGKWRFLLLLLMATVLGDLMHILGDPRSITPCIGASGGISGVIAFYALKFPKARLGILFRLYLYFRMISMPAYGMFAIWLALQVFGVWAQVSGISNVSALAHLGGAFVGFVFWLVYRKR